MCDANHHKEFGSGPKDVNKVHNNTVLYNL